MVLPEHELNKIGAYIMPVTPLVPTDVAIVFGTSYKCDLFADHIFDLWQKAVFKKLITTGAPIVRGGSAKESVHLKSLLVSMGMPGHDIITEEKSTNTGENIEFSLPFLMDLEAQGFSLDPLLGIGKAFAARRCLMTMERHLPGMTKIFSPINTFSGVDLDNWQDYPKFVSHLLEEYQKIPEYLEKGFIAEVELQP